MSDQVVVADPAFGISLRTILDKDGRREIVFQLPVPLNVTDEELNNHLDKVYRAVDRQVAIQELKTLEAEIKLYEEQLPKFEEQYRNITKKAESEWYKGSRKGSFDPDKHLGTSEQQARKGIATAIERDRNTVEKHKARIGVLQALVNGHGTVSGADRQPGVPDR